jgi:hypothetical protein
MVLCFQIDNRIRYGIKHAFDLGIIKQGATVIAVQGWRSGNAHTKYVIDTALNPVSTWLIIVLASTMRILSVPKGGVDSKELELQPTE